MSDHLRLRREKRSPNENAWHTIRIGAIMAVVVMLIVYNIFGFGG